MAVIGYERVSPARPAPGSTDSQLREHGCMRIFTDHGAPARGPVDPGGIAACTTCAKGPDVSDGGRQVGTNGSTRPTCNSFSRCLDRL